MMIRMPRGDIRLVRFLVNDPDGTVTNIDFTEIYFTVKKTPRDNTYKFQKRLSRGEIIKLGNGDYEVRIEPDDTNNLTYGNYKFDVQLMYATQLKETFVGDFIITEEVTFASNE